MGCGGSSVENSIVIFKESFLNRTGNIEAILGSKIKQISSMKFQEEEVESTILLQPIDKSEIIEVIKEFKSKKDI